MISSSSLLLVLRLIWNVRILGLTHPPTHIHLSVFTFKFSASLLPARSLSHFDFLSLHVFISYKSWTIKKIFSSWFHWFCLLHFMLLVCYIDENSVSEWNYTNYHHLPWQKQTENHLLGNHHFECGPATTFSQILRVPALKNYTGHYALLLLIWQIQFVTRRKVCNWNWQFCFSTSTLHCARILAV